MHILREFRLGKKEIENLLGYSPAIIFDIGANIGKDSENYKELFPNSEVYAFEPDKDAFNKLAKKNKIFSFPYAVSDTDSEKMLTARLYTNSNESGTGSSCLDPITFKQKGILSNKVKSYPVQCKRLDTILNDLGIDKVDFAHIDVEGHVMPLLDGFGKMRPKLLLLEVVHPNSDKGSIESKLKTMGYKAIRYVYPNEVFLYEE